MHDDNDYDDADALAEALARRYAEDYHAIGRAGALLLLLKAAFPEKFKDCEIVKAEGKYVVRQTGWFRSKAVNGFTLGRMVEVERQLRKTFENLANRSISDEEMDQIVSDIEMSPLKNHR